MAIRSLLWLPTPQRSGTGGESVQLADAPSTQTCAHGREQTGLLGPKAGKRAAEQPARVITPAARARVCICARRGQRGASGGVLGPTGG